MKDYITKKQIKEAPRYMIAIDYKADERPSWVSTWEWELLGADNLLDAMRETEMFFTDKIYMIHVLEKTGKLCRGRDAVEYMAILAIRSEYGNFHLHDDAHGESENFRAGYDPNGPQGYQINYLPEHKYSENSESEG